MLDNLEKATRLLTALKAAVPFEVEVLPSVVKYLQSENCTIPNPTVKSCQICRMRETRATSSPKENARH